MLLLERYLSRLCSTSQGAERDALWEELKKFTPVGAPAAEELEGGDAGAGDEEADAAPPAAADAA